MKIKVEELRTAFGVVDNVALNPVLESSAYVRVHQDGARLSFALTGSLWSEASLQGTSQGGKWTEYVDRRLLKAFLASCSATEVDVFFRPKEKLTFKADQRLEVAPHAVVQGYESWAPKTSFDLTADQKSLLATAVKYLPQNVGGTENMNGVWFGSGIAIATDSISMLGFYGAPVKENFIVPAETAVFLSAHDAKVSVDEDGVGASLASGYVYQPRSSQLDTFPHEAAKAQLDAGLKAKSSMTLSASELLGTLNIAVQFVFDKAEACRIETKDGRLLVTVDMATGVFQRAVKATGTLSLPVDLALKRVIPWLEYAGSSQIEYSKMANCSCFRFTDKKRRNVLLVADV